MRARYLFWFCVAPILLISNDVDAWTILNRCAGSNEPGWSSGPHPIYDLRCSAQLPTFPNASSQYGTVGFSDARDSMRSALWMWKKDSTASGWIYEDSSQCLSGPENGDWWESSSRGTGGTSEFWYEPTSIVSDLCDNSGGNTIGCASQRYSCWTSVRIIITEVRNHNSETIRVHRAV